MANQIIKTILAEIKTHDKPENKHNYQRYYKEKLKHPVQINTKVLRKISGQCFRQIKGLSERDILKVCEEMLKSRKLYLRFFAFDWAEKICNKLSQSDFARFEKWIKQYVDDWGSCDHFCCGALGKLIRQYPDLAPRVLRWTSSKNIWFRRAAAVSLILPVRNGKLLKEVFETADRLLLDDEDLVMKGYAWMLKEAGNRFPDEVLAFLKKRNEKMPRPALGIALENYPAKMRREATPMYHTRLDLKG